MDWADCKDLNEFDSDLELIENLDLFSKWNELVETGYLAKLVISGLDRTLEHRTLDEWYLELRRNYYCFVM